MEMKDFQKQSRSLTIKSSFYPNFVHAYLLNISLSISFCLTQDVIPFPHLSLTLEVIVCSPVEQDFPRQHLSLWFQVKTPDITAASPHKPVLPQFQAITASLRLAPGDLLHPSCFRSKLQKLYFPYIPKAQFQPWEIPTSFLSLALNLLKISSFSYPSFKICWNQKGKSSGSAQ